MALKAKERNQPAIVEIPSAALRNRPMYNKQQRDNILCILALCRLRYFFAELNRPEVVITVGRHLPANQGGRDTPGHVATIEYHIIPLLDRQFAYYGAFAIRQTFEHYRRKQGHHDNCIVLYTFIYYR